MEKEAIPSGQILNLGCGDHRVPGAIGVDWNPNAAAVDVVHDLNRLPYPFPDNQFRRIICQDILEHLDDIPAVVGELYRILQPGGILWVRVPHYTSADAYGDPTHRHYFSVRSFDFCLEGRPTPPGLESPARFRLRRRKILFYRPYRLLGIAALANRFPDRWEAHFAYCFPATNLIFEMEAIKTD